MDILGEASPRRRAPLPSFILVLTVAAATAGASAPAVPVMPAARGPAADASLTGQAVVERYLAKQDVPAEMAFIAMVVSSPGAGPKEYRFLTVHHKRADGGRDALLRVLRPRDVEGVALLVAEPASGAPRMSLFLPEVGRVRPLGEQGLSGAFLGSNFTYEDLRREIPDIHDYERLEDTTVREVPCFRVRAREKSGGVSAYAWRDLLISRDAFDLLRVDFYGKGGKLTKSLNAFEYRSAQVKGETRRPRRAVMRAVGSDAWTDFTVVEGRIGLQLPEDLFTARRQETWTPAEVEEFIFRFGMLVRGGI
ncbi:MAG TPA: outer membrane lipoprotein-sorting protein [Candidatus Polarisedimenticolia bacterium]|nr:outer membrane lipoprotein-sorting protein [Candidatus Polarisedimenticolia bacterium]